MKLTHLFLLIIFSGFVLTFPPPAKASPAECTCYFKGRAAAQEGHVDALRSDWDGCMGLNYRAWGHGYGNTKPSSAFCSSNNNNSPGVYRADWMVWLHKGQTGYGCPSGYPKLYGGYCFPQCPSGYYGFHLGRGDICAQCPSGASKVDFQADGQVYCYK